MERIIQIIYRLGLILIWSAVVFCYALIAINGDPFTGNWYGAIVGVAVIGYGLYRLLRWVLRPNRDGENQES